MSLKDALNILTQATAVIQTDRKTHQKIIEALQVIEKLSKNDKKS